MATLAGHTEASIRHHQVGWRGSSHPSLAGHGAVRCVGRVPRRAEEWRQGAPALESGGWRRGSHGSTGGRGQGSSVVGMGKV